MSRLSTVALFAAFALLSALTPTARCDFLSNKGSFNKSTCTAPCTQDITTVGFQPKAYMLWSMTAIPEGFRSDMVMDFGMTDGTTSRAAASGCTNAVSTTKCGRRWSAKVITLIIDGAAAMTAEADHSAFLSNGFRLNWTTNDTGNYLIHYWAVGGTDITGIKVTADALSTATGVVTYAGVGFTPSFILLLTTGETATGSTVDSGMQIGVAKSTTERWAVSATALDAATMTGTMNAEKYQRTAFALVRNATNSTIDFELDFDSFTADGFKLNQTNPPAAAWLFASLAIKGPQIAVGNFGKCVTANCVDTISVGFAPGGVFLESYNEAAATITKLNCEFAIGAFDGTNQGTVWHEEKDATLPTVANSAFLTTKAIRLAAGPSTILDEANSAFSGNNFTLTWTTNSLVAAEILWFAWGAAAGGAVVKNPITRGVIAFPR